MNFDQQMVMFVRGIIILLGVPLVGGAFGKIFEIVVNRFQDRRAERRIRERSPKCLRRKPVGENAMRIEITREEDGRFIADIPSLPGAMAYGATIDEAIKNVQEIAWSVVEDRIEHGEDVPDELVRAYFPSLVGFVKKLKRIVQERDAAAAGSAQAAEMCADKDFLTGRISLEFDHHAILGDKKD